MVPFNLFTYSYTQLKYIIDNVPGTIPGTGDAAVNKLDNILACREVPSSRVLFKEAGVSLIEL